MPSEKSLGFFFAERVAAFPRTHAAAWQILSGVIPYATDTNVGGWVYKRVPKTTRKLICSKLDKTKQSMT